MDLDGDYLNKPSKSTISQVNMKRIQSLNTSESTLIEANNYLNMNIYSRQNSIRIHVTAFRSS